MRSENLLEYLINAYEDDEEKTVDELLSDIFQVENLNAQLEKEDVIELKRQFFAYVNDAEEQRLKDNQFQRDREEALNRIELTNLVNQRGYVRNNKRTHKKLVEAFINNISVPKTLEELHDRYLNGNDAQVLINDINLTGSTNWTVPRWARRGDIVLFMHAKTAKSTLTKLRTEVRKKYQPTSTEAIQFEQAIANQLAFHKLYGGKIYAIGRVAGKPELVKVDHAAHFKSRVYCDIDYLFLLDTPVDISEFNSFINISRQSAVTAVYGKPYEELKELISSKNKVEEYFVNSYSTPIPHNMINQDNWMKLGMEYRNAFTLEIQFRQCYVDYLLRAIGDQKTIYTECACHKQFQPVTFVDNVIKIGKKLLPVEVKLNIKLESNLEGQCEQYCELEHLYLDKKSTREASKEKLVDDKVLVIDTYAVYTFSLDSREIKYLYDLDDLLTEKDIRRLRELVCEWI